MTDDSSTIPVKAHNTRDALTGILFISSYAERSTEVGAERLAHERHILQIAALPTEEEAKRAAIFALEREAVLMRKQRDSNLYGRALWRWIAGKLGLTEREVRMYLR